MNNLPAKPTKKQIINRLGLILLSVLFFIVLQSILDGEPVNWMVTLYTLGGMALVFAMIGVYVYRKPAITTPKEYKRVMTRQSWMFIALGILGSALLVIQLIYTPEAIRWDRVVGSFLMAITGGIGLAQSLKIKNDG